MRRLTYLDELLAKRIAVEDADIEPLAGRLRFVGGTGVNITGAYNEATQSTDVTFTASNAAALVTSVHTRTGDVVAAAGDYNSTQITHGSGSVSTALDTKVDQTTTISAGTGLAGGGDLSANQTLRIDTAGASVGQFVSYLGAETVGWGTVPSDSTKADKPTAGAYRIAAINAGNNDFAYSAATLDGTDLNLGAINLKTTGFIGVGASPAASGTVRLAHGATISGRNSGNSADLVTLDIGVTTADSVTLRNARQINFVTSSGVEFPVFYMSGFGLYIGNGNGSYTSATYLDATISGLFLRTQGTVRASVWNSGVQFGAGVADFGAGVGVLGVDNAATEPTTNPTGGAIWWAYTDAALKVRSSSGQVSELAPIGYANKTTLRRSVQLKTTSGGTMATYDVAVPSGYKVRCYGEISASDDAAPDTNYFDGYMRARARNNGGTLTTPVTYGGDNAEAGTFVSGAVSASVTASGGNLRITVDQGATGAANVTWDLTLRVEYFPAS